jgi:F-type H+-transporting ATPase subunit b
MDGLQKREDAIVSARTDAETARSEAQKLLDEIKSQRAKANDEISALIGQARKDADAFRESEKARTAAEIQTERERLKREIETARDQALQEIWDKTVQVATLISSKALGRVVSDDDHRRLIDESLAELGANIGAKA